MYQRIKIALDSLTRNIVKIYIESTISNHECLLRLHIFRIQKIDFNFKVTSKCNKNHPLND